MACASFQTMVLRSPALHFSCRAPRITTAILHSAGCTSSPARLQRNLGSDRNFSTRISTSKCAGVLGQRDARGFSVRAQVDEEAAAKAAAMANVDEGVPTVFGKIVSGEIPATVVYENEKVLAFRDINPQAPVHVVLIPKQRNGLTQLSRATEANKEVLGELLFAAKVVAEQERLEEGFRVVINDGSNGCQSVFHLHLHLLGGRQLQWPPG